MGTTRGASTIVQQPGVAVPLPTPSITLATEIPTLDSAVSWLTIVKVVNVTTTPEEAAPECLDFPIQTFLMMDNPLETFGTTMLAKSMM